MKDVGRSSVMGVVWNGATFGLSKVVVLVTTIILARLLTPDDFGLLSIGLIVIGYLDFINDFGISAAVIQHDGDPDETADTAFWINLALGFALGGIGVLLAEPIAGFFGEPEAVDVMRVLSLSFPLTSIGSIHEARLRRELRFGRRVVPEVLKGVSKGAVSISMALAGYGVWSLVWGQLAGTLVAAVCYWFACRWIPRPRINTAIVRSLFGFGSQMTLVGLLGGLHKNVDYLIVGRRLGTRELGLYTMAFRLPQLLVESVVDITGQVAFPAFARVRDDPDRVRSGLRTMLTAIGIVVVPLGLGLALVSDPFVRVFYGAKWEAAIPVMQVLALFMVVQSMSKTCGDVYKAMGRPSILNKLAVLKLAVTVPLLLVAASRGIVAVAVAQLIGAAILTVARLVIAARVVDAPLVEVFRPFLPAIRAGAVMSVACLGTMSVMDGVAPALELVIVAAVGAASYVASLAVFDRTAIEQLARKVRRGERRSGAAAEVGS